MPIGSHPLHCVRPGRKADLRLDHRQDAIEHGAIAAGDPDDFSCNVAKDPVHVRDFHATVLHRLGFDHERFTFRHLGLDQRLTGVERARVVKGVLA